MRTVTKKNGKLKQQENFKQNGGNKSFLKWTMLS